MPVRLPAEAQQCSLCHFGQTNTWYEQFSWWTILHSILERSCLSWGNRSGTGIRFPALQWYSNGEERRAPTQRLIQTQKNLPLPLLASRCQSVQSSPCAFRSLYACFLLCLFVNRKGQGLIAASPKLKEGGE